MAQLEQIKSFIEDRLPTYQEIALDIHAHPEVSNYEFYSSEALVKQLKAEGFIVDYGVAGHRTGFDARYKAEKPGPTICFLAEYDALPGIGHACGHNLFGTISVLAASALKEIIEEIGGEIRVYGTPGEEGGENGSAKGSFVREHFFDDVDAAICVHPGTYYSQSSPSLANDPVDIKFYGRASHAAAAPEKGINALDAVIQVYNSINALREHLPSDVRIHGVITDGGVAANVVPEFASARFYLRAATRPTLNEVYEKVENIVKGAALQTGCTYEFGLFQNSVDNTVLTPIFDDVFFKHVKEINIPDKDIYIKDFIGVSLGSTDVGNVSQVIPTIQPTVSISDEYIAGHSIEFREASKSPKGLASIALGAELLARTARDLILEPDTLAAIKQEHQENLKKQF